MATYYVRNGGSDSGDGLSHANAWKTIAKVNAATFSAGDQILFECGGTWDCSTDTYLQPPSKGSSSAQVTFGSYGNLAHGKPVFDGNNSVAALIRFFATKTYLTFENLRLINFTDYGIHNTNAKYMVCTNLTVENGGNDVAPDVGIRVEGTTPSVEGIVIQDCTFGTLGSTPADAVNNTSVFLQGVTGAIVRRNTFNNEYMVAITIMQGTGDSESCVVEKNLIHGCYGGIKLQQSNSCVVRYNVIRDGNGLGIGVTTCDNTAIHHNIIYNIAKGVQIWNGVDYVACGGTGLIYNNYIAKVYRHCLMFDNGTFAVTVKNNILDSSENTTGAEGDSASPKLCIGVRDAAGITLTSDYNQLLSVSHTGPGAQGADVWVASFGDGIGTFYNFSGWQAEGYDANSQYGDPLVRNAAGADFILRDTSPCIGAGEDLGGDYDDALKEASSWPSGVETIAETGSWEIGPYFYEKYNKYGSRSGYGEGSIGKGGYF